VISSRALIPPWRGLRPTSRASDQDIIRAQDRSWNRIPYAAKRVSSRLQSTGNHP
jgi:hypothetical protein